jgi:hypothetical protein
VKALGGLDGSGDYFDGMPLEIHGSTGQLLLLHIDMPACTVAFFSSVDKTNPATDI